MLVLVDGIVIVEQFERMKFWKKHSERGNPRFKVKYAEVKYPCNQKHSKKDNNKLGIN